MEKKIKRLFSMFFMLIMACCMVCLTSCKEDDDEDDGRDSRLVGTWECTESGYNWTSTETFTFNADGTGTYNYHYESDYYSDKDEVTLTWQTKNNKTISGTATFVEDGKKYTEKISAEYSISGNTLTIIGSLSADTDTNEVMVFTKKK